MAEGVAVQSLLLNLFSNIYHLFICWYTYVRRFEKSNQLHELFLELLLLC